MLIMFGTRLYGSVERFAGTRIATKFFHVSFLPLIPLESHLILAEQGRSFRGIRLGLDLRSVLAGYARIWAPLAAAGLASAGFGEWDDGNAPGAIALWLCAGIAVTVSIAMYAFFGKLSLDARAQRLAYGLYAGQPLDVARITAEPRERLRQTLHARVVELARSMASTGYRTALDPATQWSAIALEPGVNEPGFLTAALTLARLEWAAATGAAQVQLASAHEAIWQKLRAVDPRVLEAARAA